MTPRRAVSYVILCLWTCQGGVRADWPGQIVWSDGLDGPYVPVNKTLDIHQTNPPTSFGQPPWNADNELNTAGSLPPNWYAGFVHWHGANERHWGVTLDTTDKTEGSGSLRLAYASFGASTADITDIYLGTKFPTQPGRRYLMSFDHRMDFMGGQWPSDPREKGWTQYSVVLNGSLENMPGIEDYPPNSHPLTRYIFYTDGTWQSYEYEFVATHSTTAFVWDFRKNRDFPGTYPLVKVGDGYRLDNIRLKLIEESTTPSTGQNRITNGDFSGGLTGWTPWKSSGSPAITASNGLLQVAGAGFSGGAYQQFDTCGPGSIVTVTGRWSADPTTAAGFSAELLAINANRVPQDGVPEAGGSNNAITLYRNTAAGGWNNLMPLSSNLPGGQYQISFTASADKAAILLKSANTGPSGSQVRFTNIEVRCVPAAATLNSLPAGFERRSLTFGNGGMVKMGQSPVDGDLYAVKNDGDSPLYRVDLDGVNLSSTLVANMRTLGLQFENGAEGLTFDALGNIYVVSHEGDIIKGTYNAAAGTFTWSTFLNLPENLVGGWHGVNGAAIDEANQKFYVCSGTLKNEATQSNWWQFTSMEGRILRCSLDAGLTAAQRLNTVETYVLGIRNTFGISFRIDGRLFGVDNSPDPNFNCDAADEFNLLLGGRHYGWPYNYGSDTSGNDGSFGAQCTIAPPAGLDPWGPSLMNFGPNGRPSSGQPGYTDGGVYYGLHPHSSPDGITFYEPNRMDPSVLKFPREFHGRAFVARFGSTGNDVLSMRLNGDDSGYVCNTFVSGLSNSIDVLAARNGRLYVLEYGGGSKLHEIRYTVPPDMPQISLSTLSFHRTMRVGTALSNDTLSISNTGTATLNYVISESTGWLEVSPISGSSTGPTDINTVTISYSSSNLPCGTHQASIVVGDPQASNSPQTITVTVTVRSVKPDLDCDGDVDQSDFGQFQECYSGPGIAATAACQAARFDADQDVDTDDYAVFSQCMSGADVPASEGCDSVP